MKPTAYLINVARGPIVDAEALRDALLRGHLAGAALDVFDTEPLPPSSPLWDTPGIFISPHIGGDAIGWEERVIRVFAQNVGRYLGGSPLLNVVDLERGY
jgi:phosphoglycerate dehydrogenase-like enzyme